MQKFLAILLLFSYNLTAVHSVNANEIADNALIKAVKLNNLKAAQKALSLNANVESRKMGSNTLLTFSAYNNHYEILKLLIENGANINRMDASTYPLHAASDKNYKNDESKIKIVKYLVENGANINAIDKKGHSPLSTAVKANNYDIASYLVESGAEPELKTPDGTIFEISKRQKNLFLVKLISRAVNKKVLDSKNDLVKHLTKRYNDFFKANLSGNLTKLRNTRTKKILDEMEEIYAKQGKQHLLASLTKEISEKQELAIKNGKFIPYRLSKEYDFYELTHNYKRSRILFYSNPKNEKVSNMVYILIIMFENDNNVWKVDNIGMMREKLNSGQSIKELVKERLKNLDNNVYYNLRW